MQEKAVSRRECSRQLNILDKLKDSVRCYRAGEKGCFLEDIISNYLHAAQILANEQNSSIANVLSDVSSNLKETINGYIPKVVDLRKISLHQSLIDISSPQAVEEFQRAVKEMEDLRKLYKSMVDEFNSLSEKNSKGKTPSKKSKEEDINPEDSSIVKELKAEIAAIIVKKFRNDKDKADTLLKQLSQAKTIKVSSSSRDGWCKFEVDNISEELRTKLYYTTTRSSTNKIVYSAYGQIEKDTFDVIKTSKGRSFDTAIGDAEKKKNKQTKQQDKREKQREVEFAEKQKKLSAEIEAIKQRITELASEVPDIIKELVSSIDSYELFIALAQDNEKGKELLETLFSREEAQKIQDELRDQSLQEAIYDKNVWSLYETPKDKGQSYFQSLVTKLVETKKVSEVVRNYFDEYSINPNSDQNNVINQIAGLEIPHSIAKDVFLQEVFEQGMGLHAHDKFSQKNFDVMNQILQNNGYRITFDHYKIDKTCNEAMPESAKVLQHMHDKGPKDIKNKKIGLLLRMGEILQKEKGEAILQETFGGEGKELFNLFENIYYEDKGDHTTYWRDFIKNNKSLAKEVYQIFADQPNLDIKKCAQRLCHGEYIKGAKQDIHHIFTRKYAGLFNNAEIEFNHPSLLASTMSFHVADADPHIEAHLFDTKSVYMVYENGKYSKRNSINGVSNGSILAIPQLEKRGKDGKFHPIIEPDTLFVTSTGKVIKEPKVSVAKQNSRLLTQKEVVNVGSYINR